MENEKAVIICPDCQGKGRVIKCWSITFVEYDVCDTCDGKGSVLIDKTELKVYK